VPNNDSEALSEQGQRNDNPSSAAALKQITEVAAIFAAMAFVAGWSYVASYYNTFGLNPLEIDISTQVAAALAIQVIYESTWPLLAFVACGALLLIVGQRIGHLHSAVSGPAILLLFFTMMVAGIHRGRLVADRDMRTETTRLPQIGLLSVTGLAATVKDTGPSCIANGTIDCRLLLHWRSTWYVFVPLKEGNLHLYEVPDSQVLMTHIVRGAQ
jgi:hypothetical protein